MKFKRIIAVLLVLCSVFALAACGTPSIEDTVKKASWESKQEVAFADYLKHVVSSRYAEKNLTPEIGVSSAINMTKEQISANQNNNLPVTFTVTIDGKATYAFNMLYKDGVLSIVDGKNLDQNQPYEAETVQEILEPYLKDEIK